MRFSRILRDPVKFQRAENVGIVTLNRPKALNALNHPIVKMMRPQLKEWEESGIDRVILKAEGGKAFCAGGDIKDLTLPTYDGDYDSGANFFREEYQLDYQLGTYSKPVISLIHGVVMGGGVGISCHTPIRVATEKTLFAMPETDVGGGYFLPRIPIPGLGLFLGLTGQRLKGADCQHGHVSTHTISSDKLEQIEKYLISLPQNLVAEEISEAIQKFQVPIGDFSLASQLDNIAKYFDDPKSLLELVQELESSSGEWEQKIAKKLRSMSPTSLAITFQQIQDGKNMSFYDVFAMEYRLAYQCLRHEFPEGVRALLVDRDNNPKWNPATIEEIPDSLMQTFFEEKPNAWHPTKPWQSNQ
ncbi:Oidioi.mRNA.OKI2018_I69.chr1.g2529.t1.cds [Oikopleura dioica]|uniref:3-hydroxyisobutyryl-CoA hydrolase, mitochondrial n=1 Tax=Oikopleura dioica TaxID=34765 RepID=A0ABN7T0I8_OIKDI|nr:Oidioi.mRNA.OKI2018_I69.chr1.g2529.t1.cds [Oikopleura dioica]